MKNSLVRILHKNTSSVIGGGFLITPTHIVTCAHVVADSIGYNYLSNDIPSEIVFLDFPLLQKNLKFSAKVISWFPVKTNISNNIVRDIAVLELLDDTHLPEGSCPAPVVFLEDNHLDDRMVKICGFPREIPEGDWINGSLQGLVSSGLIQLNHEVGRRCISRGFSGTPVWDKQERAVVGIVVSINTRENERIAYVIPSSLISLAWPLLPKIGRPANPYKGLSYFREEDANLFFGREHFIKKLFSVISNRQFILMIGASGTGKSSILNAGIIPLAQYAFQGLVFPGIANVMDSGKVSHFR
ncbi:S1 family peptidase [Thiothrix nivea]|uniref:Novel STAND NTPase 1 domain-containing protein n=1 Tax=Thiothrix nivea (strain ATCC 35100 / DSM 5205 / JP2) TaxID=870187 RepID=A0A656HET8_THINJ|nr:serine protease [Thiothrix nivea]EIJ35438.1 hypothetical protein Thini_2907 [Thiothrix nivea DSM 5205]